MTISPIQPDFKAQWIEPLRPKEPTLSQKVAKAAWDALSILIFPIGLVRILGWGVHFVARHLALPSSWLPSDFRLTSSAFKKFCNQSKQHYEINRYTVETPDDVKLQAIHFKHKKADANTPTVILFCSSNSYIESNVNGWIIQAAKHRPCNFVAFNYRGIRDWNAPRSANDLKIDGESIFQFVRHHLHVPASHIRWFGWSLGGCIATNVKVLHPECNGPFANIRSFSSSKEVAREVFRSRYIRWWFPWALEKQSWLLRAPLEKLRDRGPLLIVYHKDDQVTPLGASAYQAATAAKIPFEAFELTMSPEEEAKCQHQLARGDLKHIDHHSEPLRRYQTACKKIADFLLPIHTLNNSSRSSNA